MGADLSAGGLIRVHSLGPWIIFGMEIYGALEADREREREPAICPILLLISLFVYRFLLFSTLKEKSDERREERKGPER